LCIVICKIKLDFQLVISLYDVYSNQVAQSELIKSARLIKIVHNLFPKVTILPRVTAKDFSPQI